MKNQVNKNFLHKMQRIMIIEMIDAGFMLAEKLGKHPMTKGCKCINCVNKRKRILRPFEMNWEFKL